MGSINSIVQQKNIAPHINLGVDNAARVKSYLIWLPFVGLSLRCLFSPLMRLPKKKKELCGLYSRQNFALDDCLPEKNAERDASKW